MKITIAHTDRESQTVEIIVRFLRNLCPGAKISRKDKESEFKHTYITTRRKSEA